jgi:hypothetical protein
MTRGNPDSQALEDFLEAYRFLGLEEYKEDSRYEVLLEGLEDIMDNPDKGLQYVKDNKEFLKEQIQQVAEF